MGRPLVTDISRDWVELPGRRQLYISRVGSTGDHVTPLPYTLQYSRGKAEYGPPWDGKPLPFDVGNLLPETIGQNVYNKAYAKFKSKALGDQSQLGSTFAEWRESLGMIRNAALTARESWKSFRKGKLFKKVRKDFERNGSAGGTASKSWLQYWFGWAPLVGDIQNAAKVLDQPIPYFDGSGSAGDAYHRVGGYIGDWYIQETSGLQYVKVGGRVYLENMNLFLAAQMGVINPVSVAWEVVPFSFLVDWVFDVGSYLESFTDFVGCRVENAYTTAIVKKGVLRVVNQYVPSATASYELVAMTRGLGLPRPIPNWEVSGNLGSSVTRAASAVSLLHETLRSTFR